MLLSTNTTSMLSANAGTRDVLKRDQACLRKLTHVYPNKQLSIPSEILSQASSTNPGIIYTTSLGVGIPPTFYNVLLDNTNDKLWIGTGKDYIPTQTSKSTRRTASMNLGPYDFIGAEYADLVTLGSFTVENHPVNITSEKKDLKIDIDGVLGAEPRDHDTSRGFTLIDAILPIAHGPMSVSYGPLSDEGFSHPQVTSGEFDTTRFVGSICYAPLIERIDMKYSDKNKMCIRQTLTYGGSPIIEAGTGLFDYFSTLVLLENNSFKVYQAATGAILDEKTGLLTVTANQFKGMEDLFLDIGTATYKLNPSAQIWPTSLNTKIGGELDKIYLVLANQDCETSSGPDIIFGYSFMRHFHTVYDGANAQIGLAPTPFTEVIQLN